LTSASPSLTTQLVRRLAQPVDDASLARARLHLLDWLACVAGARRSPVAAAGDNAVASAALLGNLLEMDDVHRAAILHPGPVVWPTLLEARPGATWRQLLAAAVRGYETAIGIGSALDARHYRFFHNSATAGTFAAAAAAASLLELDEAGIVAALGLAGSVTGGLWQMRLEPVTAKQWHIDHARTTGLAAARYAARGLTGPHHILEGPLGLFAATCAAPRPALVVGGGHWRIHDVSFKPWGACRHAHPAIDAALDLKAGGALDGPLTVATYRDALTFCDRPDPRTVSDAKFSLQHAVAVVAVRGEPQLADFEPDAIADPALAAARARVTVVEDSTMTGRFPDHFGARVSAGDRSIELIDARGDPERPLGAAGIVAKARALIAWGGLEASEADDAVALVLDSDLDDSSAAIVDLLRRWLA
jgi:2-methylcitrate dehydratase PrpD